jgi:hypothetical protein
LAVLALLFSGCYGDFGRPRPSYFGDNRAWWMGTEAALSAGTVPSVFPLTDDEILMRDLAFNLIMPPYDRARWDALLREFFRSGIVPPFGPPGARTIYGTRLFARWFPSAAARYAQLTDDIRNDVVRLDSFTIPALTVLDLDRKRAKSLEYVSTLVVGEPVNAGRRIAENALIVDWVRRCLGERAAAYRFALERLVIAMPEPASVEAERALTLLDSKVAAMTPNLVPAPGIAAVR